jgi:hypothetical protein
VLPNYLLPGEGVEIQAMPLDHLSDSRRKSLVTRWVMMAEMSQRGVFAMKRTYVAVGLSILIVGTFFHQQSRLTELELEMRMRDHIWAKLPTMAASPPTMVSAASVSGAEAPFVKAVPLPSVPTTAAEEKALAGERGQYGGTNDKAHLGGPARDTSPGCGSLTSDGAHRIHRNGQADHVTASLARDAAKPHGTP